MTDKGTATKPTAFRRYTRWDGSIYYADPLPAHEAPAMNIADAQAIVEKHRDVWINYLDTAQRILNHDEDAKRRDLVRGDVSWPHGDELARVLDFVQALTASDSAKEGREWTPEQFWEYADGLLGTLVRDQMRDTLTERGLTIVASLVPSANLGGEDAGNV